MLKRKVLFSLLLSCAIGHAVAQNSGGNVAPEGPSIPNTSHAEGGSSIYNVDPFTGIGSVTIPIYDYSAQGLDLGVKINYNMQGIKVDDMPGSVGCGWDLSYGGSITREARGLEDEAYLLYTDFGSWAVAQTMDERDLFTMNLCGRTIQFLIHRGFPYKVETYPKSAFEIGIYENNSQSLINTHFFVDFLGSVGHHTISDSTGLFENDRYIDFQVTDEFGNKYIFQRGDYETRYYDWSIHVSPFFYYPTDNWVLKKIITYSGAEVNYTYEYGDLNYPLYNYQAVEELSTSTRIIKDAPVYYIGKKAYIKKIEYPNGVVLDFNYDTPCVPVPKVLESIDVSSGYDQTVKHTIKYKFNHAYFSAGSTNEVSYPYTCIDMVHPTIADKQALKYDLRLKLKSIDRIAASTTERYYSFDYNDYIAMPSRLSSSKDIYGYNNGQAPVSVTLPLKDNPGQNYTISNLEIPAHTAFDGVTTYGAYRGSNTQEAMACILTTVTNGTGGYVKLFCNPNFPTILDTDTLTANTAFNTMSIAPDANDGLVVTSVIEGTGYSNTGGAENEVLTLYEFSGGQRFFRGGYFLTDVNHWFNFNATPYETFNGAIHGYSNCTVRKFNMATNEELSRTGYTYSNFFMTAPYKNYAGFSNNLYYLDVLNGTTANLYMRRTLKRYLLGQLLEEKQYIPGTTDLISQVNYTYDRRDSVYYYRNPYTGSQSSRLLHKTETMYSGANTMSATYDYEYSPTLITNSYLGLNDAVSGNVYDNVTKVTWTDSKGLAHYKKYTYAYETGGPGVLQQVSQEEHMLKNSTDYLMGLSGVNFTSASGTIQCNKVRALASQNPVTGSYTSLLKEKEYTVRDVRNNVVETKYPVDQQYTASIWDNRIGQKLAEIDNAQYQDIAQTSFEGVFASYGTADDNKGNWDFDPANVVYASGSPKPMTGRYYYNLTPGAHLNSSHVLQTGKKYILSFWASGTVSANKGTTPITLQTQTIINSYWRLYTAIVTGDNSPINITIASGSQKIDELRLYPLEASMTSYTYEPLFGISSVCDNRNNILYTEYDNMGRVKIVRDIKGNIISQTDNVMQGSDN